MSAQTRTQMIKMVIDELWEQYVDESEWEGTGVGVEDFGLYLQFVNKEENR